MQLLRLINDINVELKINQTIIKSNAKIIKNKNNTDVL